MKAVLLALAVLTAGACAWPQRNYEEVDLNNERLAADIVVTLIEEYVRLVTNRGLDPYYLEFIQGSYVLPTDMFISASGSVNNVALDGISHVEINDVSFNVITRTLSFDLAYPRVSGSVRAAAGEINVEGESYLGEGSGSLVINNLRVAGAAEMSVNYASGLTIDSLKVVLSVEGIQSNLNLNLLGHDVSEEVNNFLSNTLPESIETYEEEITNVIEYIGILLLNKIL